jgi:uncharacterized protein YecT (DUF1311 family)
VAAFSASLNLATFSEPKRLALTKMKIRTLVAALFIMIVPFASKGKEPEPRTTGDEERAAVEQANKRLDAVYKQLMGKLDADGQKALKEAERSWIKWRDDEALLMGRVEGAIGGSALREGFHLGQVKLIDQRTQVLSEYATHAAAN